MSEFTDAFTELLDANDETVGSPQFVLVNGKKKRAIIETITADDVMLGGGVGESGGFRVQVLQSEFAEAPEKGDQIEARGRKLDIVSCDDVNGATYTIVAADLAAEGT